MTFKSVSVASLIPGIITYLLFFSITSTGTIESISPPIYRHILDMLKSAHKGRLDRNNVEEELVLHLPQEDPLKIFNILTSWARYGELFAYSEDTGYITFE
jgi:hypothetical protein